MRKSVVALVVSLFALLSAAPAAWASPYPPNPPTIDVESGSVPPGGNQTVTVTGFCPGVMVTFTINPGGTVLGTAVADGTGKAQLTFAAPTTTGTYTVTATAPNPCGGGGTTTETTDFDVASDAPLPSSGTDSRSIVRVAAAVLGVGLVLVGVAMARRRRTRTA